MTYLYQTQLRARAYDLCTPNQCDFSSMPTYSPSMPFIDRFFLNAFYRSIFPQCLLSIDFSNHCLLSIDFSSMPFIDPFSQSLPFINPFPINAFYRSIFLVYEKIYWNKFCMYFLPAICAICVDSTIDTNKTVIVSSSAGKDRQFNRSKTHACLMHALCNQNGMQPAQSGL